MRVRLFLPLMLIVSLVLLLATSVFTLSRAESGPTSPQSAQEEDAEGKEIELLTKEMKLFQNELDQQVTAQIVSMERDYGPGGPSEREYLSRARKAQLLHALWQEKQHIDAALSTMSGERNPMVACARIAELNVIRFVIEAPIASIRRELGLGESEFTVYRVLKDRERRLRDRIATYDADIRRRRESNLRRVGGWHRE